jgi:hypothetical protein
MITETQTATKPDYSTYSLGQLKQLRSSWLTAGVKIAPTLRKILETLGAPQSDPTHRCPRVFAGVFAQGWQAYLWEIEDTRDVRNNCWHTHGTLWVEVGNETPVRIHYQNGQVVTTDESVFVPGRWTAELLALEVDADQTIQCRADLVEANELESMRKLLCIGELI